MNEQLIDLQIQLSHQEQVIHELSGVVYEQQKTLDKLTKEMRQLRERPRGERLSYEAIAAQLNEQGRTTRYGKAWTRAGVFQVLSR